MRSPLSLGLLLLLLILPAARAADAPALAALEAPMSENWTPDGRWNDESLEEKKVVRAVAGTCYASMPVLGEIPAEGNLLLRVHYYSSGKAFAIGIGSWGSPTVSAATRPKGWHTDAFVFDAARITRLMSDKKIPLIIQGGGPDGPAFAKIELLNPDPADVMKLYRAWVIDATAAAFAATSGAGFTEAPEKDETPVEPSADDTARGAIPFVRSYVKFVFPVTVPAKAERVTKGKVVLTPGEYEPFQFAIRALKDFEELSAELAAPAPKGLEAEIRWVECAPVHNGGSRANKFKIQPNRLWPKEIFPTCTAKKDTSRAWYLTVKAADDLAAGSYPLKIDVKEKGQPVASFEVEVAVLPFKLPKVTERCFMLVDAGMIEEDSVLADLAAHGVSAVGAFNEFQPLKGKEVDFALWDAYFAKLRKHGLDNGFFWYLGNPKSGNAVKDGAGAENFEKILKELDARVKDGRYPKLFALSIDEAVNSAKAFADSNALFQQLRDLKLDLKVLGCSLDRFKSTVRYEGHIDLLACNGSFDENAKWCREKNVGLNMYSYVCAGVAAGSTRLNYGFHPWRHGALVVNGWALRWYNGHPFNDLDNTADWGILFPNWTGRPIATPSWEGFREGVDDQRYLDLLASLVKDGKADGKLLDEIRANGIGKMTEQKETVVGDSVFGALMNNADDLEVARARVIQEILKALKK